MSSPRLALATRAALLAAVYVVVAKLGLRVATVGHSVTLVWPPTGLALAALLLRGRGLWPGVALGAFIVNVTTPGVGALTAGLIALGNTLEAVTGVTLLTRDHFHSELDRTRDVFRFAGWGALACTAVSATIGTLGLWAGGHVAPAALVDTWRVWWVGDAMGALVVAPLLLTWSSPVDDQGRRSPWEVAALGLALLVGGVGGLTEPHVTRPYLVFPPLIWAALRFGPRGATAATFAISAITVASTVTNRGAFVVSSLGESLMALHAFMASVAVTALVLGATAAERARAIRVRENFISIASHELRTPLAPMRLQVQRVLRGLRKPPGAMPTETVIDALEVVDRQIERLTTLLESVLDLTRIRLGRLTLAAASFDLAALVDEIAASLREPLAQAGCTLRVETGGPTTGTWDRSRVSQVITNLIVNAMRYGGKGVIELTLVGGEDRVLLVVRDYGPGVPQGDEERIFRRFEHNATKTGSRGLGLGLYIAREIVEAHGGRLELERPKGGGAAFRVELPVRTERVSGAQPSNDGARVPRR